MTKSTAIITGSSDGLGKFFALDLASRHIDLVLIALPNSGLQSLSKFIRFNFKVLVTVLELDLTVPEAPEYIFETLKNQGITADMLINNAGVGNWSWFEEKDNVFYKTQIDLNISSTVLLTRLFLEHIDHSTKSYILNVGSLGSRFIVPKKLVYGATKSFISYFTKCLQVELLYSQTSVTLLSPGGINTKPELLVLNNKLKGVAKASILDPDKVAKIAVDGLLQGKTEVIPGLVNRVLVMLNTMLPAPLKQLIIRYKLKSHLND